MKLVIIFVALLVGIGWYFYDKNRQSVETGEFVIGGRSLTVEIADSLPKQIQGLSGREELCDDCGMIFTYDRPKFQTFTMKGMRFPLDMIFIEGGRIAEIREGIRYPEAGEEPQVVTSTVQADMVLEVNSGFSRTHGLKVGDRAVLTRQ